MCTIEVVVERLKSLGIINSSNIEGNVVYAYRGYEFEGESFIKVEALADNTYHAFVDYENAPVIAFEVEAQPNDNISISNIRVL